MVNHTHNKVHGIQSAAYLVIVMAEDRMNSLNVSNQRAITTLLTLCLLVPPADNLCIQFEPRTDPKCADPGIFVRKREREKGRGQAQLIEKSPEELYANGI